MSVHFALRSQLTVTSSARVGAVEYSPDVISMSFSKPVISSSNSLFPRSVDRRIEFWTDKIFQKQNAFFKTFREHYDMFTVQEVNTFNDLRCSHLTLACSCRRNMDGNRIFNTLTSMSAAHQIYDDIPYFCLDINWCLCDTGYFCDCFAPIERTQIQAFSYLYEDSLYFNERNNHATQVNFHRIYRSIMALDQLLSDGISIDEILFLYKGLKSLVRKMNFNEILPFKDFMLEFYNESKQYVDRCDTTYVPDLVMSARPDLLKKNISEQFIAQIGESLVSRQCLRDKIDLLILEADEMQAESFFGVDINIPENTSATLLSIISELKDSIKDTLVTAFKYSVMAVAAILYMVLAFVIIHRIVTLKPRYIAMLHIFCTLAILYNDETSCLHTLFAWCKQQFSTVVSSDRVAEDGTIQPGMLSFLPMFIISSMNIPKDAAEKIITSKFLDSLARKISFLGDARFYGGVNNISEWAKKAFESVKRHFYFWIGLEYVPDLSSEKDAYMEWTEKYEKIMTDYCDRKLLFSESERSYITSLYSEGCRLARHPIYKEAAYHIHSACRRLLILIEKVNSRLNVAGSLRNPPVTLMLHGETGAGKSSLTLPLAVAILLEIYKREDNVAMKEALQANIHRLIYTRNSEQEFWDGYTGQTVCVFDDWNQIVDSASNPSLELFELIRASNVFPYPLHMAHMDDKASVNFTSDIIICSSNNKIPKVESLNYPAALIGRFTRFVTVTRKASNNAAFSFEDYILTPYSPKTGNAESSITVNEFIKMSVDEYMKKKQFVSSINSFVETLFAQSGVPEQEDKDILTRLYNTYNVSGFKAKLEQMKADYKYLAMFNFPLIVGAITLVGAGICLYKYINPSEQASAETTNISDFVRKRKNLSKWKRNNEQENVDESYTPILKPTPRTTEVYDIKPKINAVTTEAYETIPKRQVLTSEACIDLAATEMGSKIARSNFYRVYLDLRDQILPLGHCLFIKGNVAIMPMHFVTVMNTYDTTNTIYFSNAVHDKLYETRVRDIRFSEYVDKYGNHKDLVSFQLRHVRQHADITEMFAPSSCLKTTGATTVCLTLLNCVSTKHPLIVDRHIMSGKSCVKYIENPSPYRLASTSDMIKIHSAWEYSLETQKGDCGAPLIAINPQIGPGKIIGIHVAGVRGIGMSTAFFIDDAKAICEKYSMYAQVDTLDTKEGNNPYSGLELLYKGELDFPIIQPCQSKIIPSVVHGLVQDPKTDLCWLRPRNLNGEIFDPLVYRTERMGKASVCIPHDLVDLAAKGLLDEFKRVYLRHQDHLVDRFECPYSLRDTCLGVNGEEFVNAIKRDTSAGFPFTQLGVTRSMIFGTGDEYNLDSPEAKEILSLVTFYEKCANEGIILDHYFIDTLKDERKPKEKCHKTRMFAAGPIDYLIWSKRWFNGVVAIISELRNLIHISVGTNVYSDDWHMMVEQLTRKSDLFVAGDFEGFDATQQAYLLRSGVQVLIEFSQYIFGDDPYARKQMEAIAEGLVFSYHISGKSVIQWMKSLPSGHYLTAISNSCFVLLALSSAYLLALQKQGKQPTSLDVSYFWNNFGLVSYGDDHVIAVPHSCVSFYNQNTLVELLKEFGLSYTDESKSERGISDYRSITEISYLKRSFRFSEQLGKWIAPLDIKVILETPMWIRKCPDVRQHTFDNIEFALRELSLHDNETWNTYAPLLLRLAEEKCGLVSKFSDKQTTMLFVIDSCIAQSSDVIFEEDINMQGQKLFQLLSEEAVGIYPYHTGSAQAAPKHPVNLARPRREGALEAQSNSPADTPQVSNFSSNNTNEVKASQYVDQVATDDTVQITTFENDLSIVTQDVPMPKPLETNLRSMHTDDAHHTIVSFLKRPMILREFTWNSSQVRGTDIFPKIRVPFDMIVRQFRQKLQGFMSFRATAVITVQFQTQPFQAGRFLMAAVPVPSLIGNRTKLIEGRISNLTLLNHVQADIAKQTQVELRVPYISPLIAYDLVQGRYDWAEVVGKVYSPVSSVGTTNVEGIVYVHFEDIQLGAPTSQPVFEETETLFAQAGDANKKLPFEPDALTDIRMRAQEAGLTSANSSRATGALRKINGKLGEYLDFAKPVTETLDKWLLKPVDDFLGPVLNIFGFSKPIVESDDKLLRPTTLFSTLEGHDRALTLATSDDVNAPFIPNLNGTDLDEMSFDYLKKIPQYIDHFTYSTTNARNDCLYNFFVRPSFRAPETIKVSATSFPQPSHLSYITEPFAYWTGSIVLTLKFVKTDYHSGRVEITYHPNCNPMKSKGVVKDTTDFDMAYRYIVDLREKNEISLRVPYIAVTPFKRNVAELVFPPDVTDTSSLVELNSGVVIVRALTPLKASNAVVSNTIEVLVEYNAGNDFSVMNPITTRFNPVTPLEQPSNTDELETQSDWSGYYSDEISLEAQSGEASTAGLAITRQQAIEGEDPPSITHNMGEMQPRSSSLLVTGENFQNFRDLAHRTNFVLRVPATDNFEIAVSNFYIPPPLSRNSSQGVTSFGFDGRANSALGYIGSMYALCRGSVNLRVLPQQYKDYLGASLFFNDSTAADCMYPLAIENSSVKGLAEYHIPYYCRTYQFDHLKYNNSLLYDLNFAIATPSTDTKTQAFAAVGGGDDISYGYFIGTPFCLIPASTLYAGSADPFVRGVRTVVANDGYVAWSDINIS